MISAKRDQVHVVVEMYLNEDKSRRAQLFADSNLDLDSFVFVNEHSLLSLVCGEKSAVKMQLAGVELEVVRQEVDFYVKKFAKICEAYAKLRKGMSAAARRKYDSFVSLRVFVMIRKTRKGGPPPNIEQINQELAQGSSSPEVLLANAKLFKLLSELIDVEQEVRLWKSLTEAEEVAPLRYYTMLLHKYQDIVEYAWMVNEFLAAVASKR